MRTTKKVVSIKKNKEGKKDKKRENLKKRQKRGGEK